MKFILVLSLLILSNNVFSQGIGDTRAFVVGNYTFFAKTDTTDYTCNVRVKKDGKVIASQKIAEETLENVELLEENGGDKIFLMSAYTGGAHCCIMLYSVNVSGSKINLIDSLSLGNAWPSIEDINNDGKKEILTGNDMLAYAFTNYAETRFPAYIIKFNKGHFTNATSEFKDFVRTEIDSLMSDMNNFFKESEFKCEKEGDDTFNTPSGSIKTILAAIAADYQTLGETQKGYDLIDKYYTCPDKDKYISTLRNDLGIK